MVQVHIVGVYSIDIITCTGRMNIINTVHGKILANLVNDRPFAKIFLANFYKHEIPEQNYYNNGRTAKVF